MDSDGLLAVDIRSVTLTDSSALISIPGASQVFGDEIDDISAQVKVEDEGDQLRVEAVIDKPDDADLTNDPIP